MVGIVSVTTHMNAHMKRVPLGVHTQKKKNYIENILCMNDTIF